MHETAMFGNQRAQCHLEQIARARKQALGAGFGITGVRLPIVADDEMATFRAQRLAAIRCSLRKASHLGANRRPERAAGC
jgi:hypothetical protein